MAIGVLAQLAQQAHENVTREQNFRSALFQQAEGNIQKSQELRIAEQNSINTSISNMIRQQDSDLLRAQNQERLQQATDDLIRHRKVQEADTSQRTILAQDIARAQQEERDTKALERKKIQTDIQDALSRMSGGTARPAQESSLPIGEDFSPSQPSPTAGISTSGAGIDTSIAALARSTPEPVRATPVNLPGAPLNNPVTSAIRNDAGVTQDSPLLSSPPDASLFPRGPRGPITNADIIAASDTRTAHAIVSQQEIGQKGNEVVLKSPGVDPESTARAAVAEANKAGTRPNAVPSPEFVAYPETVEQQQLNLDFVEKKEAVVAQWEALAQMDKFGDNSHIIQPGLYEARLEVEQLTRKNKLTGVVDFTSDDLKLIADYNAELARNPDFVEFRNTKNDTIIRRDQFVVQIASMGKGAIKKLNDINSSDLAEAVKERVNINERREGKASEADKTLRSPVRDATLGSRGNNGPIAPSALMQSVDDMMKRNQR